MDTQIKDTKELEKGKGAGAGSGDTPEVTEDALSKALETLGTLSKSDDTPETIEKCNTSKKAKKTDTDDDDDDAKKGFKEDLFAKSDEIEEAYEVSSFIKGLVDTISEDMTSARKSLAEFTKLSKAIGGAVAVIGTEIQALSKRLTDIEKTPVGTVKSAGVGGGADGHIERFQKSGIIDESGKFNKAVAMQKLEKSFMAGEGKITAQDISTLELGKLTENARNYLNEASA